MDAKFKPQVFGDRCWKHGPESFGMFLWSEVSKVELP